MIIDNQIALYWYKATIVKVVDADTIDVNLDFGFQSWIFKRLRLYDLDAYELSGSERNRGLLAKQFVLDLIDEYSKIPNSSIFVKTIKDTTGIYSRVLAEVFFYDPSTNQYLDLVNTIYETGFDPWKSDLTEDTTMDQVKVVRVYKMLEEIMSKS